MNARSVVFDLFGGYVRDSGGEISLQDLLALLECFDVAPDSARVMMSRLSREGWFEVRRQSRSSMYSPSDKGWHLLDEGLERIMRRPAPEEWDGSWVMVTFNVPEKHRAVRTRLKTKLSWLGFGQLAPSIWISPHARLAEAEEVLHAEPGAKYDIFEARSRGIRTDAERAAACWPLDELDKDYRIFTSWAEELQGKAETLRGRSALVTRIELIHAYRKFPFRDPDLPAELLPDLWPAASAYDAFIRTFEALGPEAKAYYDSVVSQ